MSFCVERTPIARKRHICDWCGKTISKGEKYVTQSGMADDDFCHLKYHWECQFQVKEATSLVDYDSSYSLDLLHEAYLELQEAK